MTEQIDKHHIKLDGSIPYGSPLKKFMYSREALVCAGLIGYSAYRGGGLANDPLFTLTAYSAILGGAALGRAAHNWSLRGKLKQVFGSAHDDLFINKKPDENTLPTKPSHILASYTIRNNQMSNAIQFIIGGAIGIGLGAFLSDTSPPPEQSTPSETEIALWGNVFFVVLATISTYYMKYYSTAWRFNQIVRGKHVITDEPPKKTKTVPVSEEIERTFGKFLPEPAAKPETAMLPAPEPDHF